MKKTVGTVMIVAAILLVLFFFFGPPVGGEAAARASAADSGGISALTANPRAIYLYAAVALGAIGGILRRS